MQNIQNGCINDLIGNNSNNYSSMYALFTPNQHTCNLGYYLPANVDECTQCPTEHDCNGGSFYFNEKYSQGIIYMYPFKESVLKGCSNQLIDIDSENNTNMYALFVPNQHTCNPGYYLPANIDGCTICPEGNKCVGGTYAFNKTVTQGIEQCLSGTFAPVGSTVCYEHILHVGNDMVYLKSTKRTTPSLNVAYGNKVFYANMTTTPTYMTAGSTRYFKTIYNDTVYYICDDTSCPE